MMERALDNVCIQYNKAIRAVGMINRTITYKERGIMVDH